MLASRPRENVGNKSFFLGPRLWYMKVPRPEDKKKKKRWELGDLLTEKDQNEIPNNVNSGGTKADVFSI